jgi:hypothetical protein
MRVIPKSDLNNYVGAYVNDCFWRCVAYVNGTGNSEAAAASYADEYWTSQLGYYSAMNYLSVNGGGMSTSEMKNYGSVKSFRPGSIVGYPPEVLNKYGYSGDTNNVIVRVSDTTVNGAY